MGASGEEAKTECEPKQHKHLAQRSPDGTAMSQNGSRRKAEGSADDTVMRQDSSRRKVTDTDYHHQFAGHLSGTAGGARGRRQQADADLESASKHDAGAHQQPSAGQETSASHQQYDGDRPGADQPHKHAFKKQ